MTTVTKPAKTSCLQNILVTDLAKGDPVDLAYLVGAMVRTCALAVDNDLHSGDQQAAVTRADINATLEAVSEINGYVISALEGAK